MSQDAVIENNCYQSLSSCFRILGTRVDALTMSAAIEVLEQFIAEGRRGLFVALTNVNNVMEAKRDPQFRKVMDAVDLSLPDGMPLAWLSRIYGFGNANRIAGPDFVPAFCVATHNRGYRHFFYGGAEGVAEKMAEKLKQQAPGMEIAGAYSPPFRPLTSEEDDQIVEMINRTAPDVVWVGLGCPKQENWIFEHRHRIKAAALLGVGQAFDIQAGTLRRAPMWMRRWGLEWLFRLCSEPRRLWRRYLVSNTQFLFYAALQLCGISIQEQSS